MVTPTDHPHDVAAALADWPSCDHCHRRQKYLFFLVDEHGFCVHRCVQCWTPWTTSAPATGPHVQDLYGGGTVVECHGCHQPVYTVLAGIYDQAFYCHDCAYHLAHA